MADDDVVEKPDADEIAGLRYAAGEDEVLGAGGGVAGRVIVAQDQAGGVESESDLEDRSGLDGSAVEGSNVGDGPADQAVAGIEVDRDHVLLRAIGKEPVEEFGDVTGAGEADITVGSFLLLDEGDSVASHRLDGRA